MATTTTTTINTTNSVTHPSEEGNDMVSNFHVDGYVVLSQALVLDDSLKEWQAFAETYFPCCLETLRRNGHLLDRDDNLPHGLGLGIKHGFREIVMRSPARYELSFNHDLPSDLNSRRDFLSNGLTVPAIAPILKQLEKIIPTFFDKPGGAKRTLSDLKQVHLSLLVAAPGCPKQPWHADGGHASLLEHLPCHCMNVFIPLQNTPMALGPTEFRPGGHYLTRGNLAKAMLVAKCRKTLRPPVCPELTVGDVLVFDYRVLHRGRANTSLDINRNMLVLTFCEPWFEDVLNFPKRSMFDAALTDPVATDE
eukprot:Nitzschia sp. Nitz4//scaffold142_size57810//10189//11112//NITZ4_006491-RA/size57810-processed-gene-0.45-mRNA-1//1//CDS//3329536376//6574//frame0